MSAQELSELFETLKFLNKESESSPDILGRTFDTCLKLTDLIEESNLSSNEVTFQIFLASIANSRDVLGSAFLARLTSQTRCFIVPSTPSVEQFLPCDVAEKCQIDAVKMCISSLEKCTRMVNDLDLFSSNETIEEIQTSSIKYLLLPVLLGNLNLALQNAELPERYKFLEIAEVYFKDFLLRCRNYELSKRKLINKYENEILEDINSEETVIKRQTIADLAATRETKIEQYKLRKQLKERENELKPALERQDAEEHIREYYLLILERWMLTAIEELANINSEKSVIGHMMEKKEDLQPAIPQKSDIKPLKPIIITRNEIQKKVFGLGYPSLPVMTIDDFYRQRFEKMVNEHKSSGKSLQEMAMIGRGDKEEEEEIQKEVLLDKEDPEALQKARAWDDWKDDNPRGSGNRKNKG